MFIPFEKIKKTVFFDIETTTRYPTFEEYYQNEPDAAKQFKEKSAKQKEYTGMSVEEIYALNGMLWAEHGQVISIAYRMWDHEVERYTGEVFGFSSWEDYETKPKKSADLDILIAFNETLYERFGYMEGAPNIPRLGLLGGYHIKGFDIPFLYKRMLYNGIIPHPSLNIINKRSWNIEHTIDLKDWTKPFDYNALTSFATECVMLGIPNPKKDEIDGNQVCFRFWDDHAIEDINDYCMRDVFASVRMAIALSEEKMRIRHEQVMSDWIERKAAAAAAESEILEEEQE